MENMFFVVNWGGKNKERAWSGTNFSIYKALSKNFELEEIEIKTPKLISKVLGKLGLDWFTKEFVFSKIRRLKRISSGTVFQFGEVYHNTSKVHTYIYQDLSVSYVKFMKDNLHDVFEVSAYQDAYPKVIDKRADLQNKYYKSCSGIFTMGEWLRDFLIEQGIQKEKVHAVGAGINVKKELIHPQKKTNSKILFVGRDFKRKGGYITYEAFKYLKEKGEEVELYVSGPAEDPISDSIEGYHFMGDLDYSQVAELYNICDIFCMPSYFEAYGLVFIEALSYGLPCIGRDCYEMPYFIEDGQTGALLKEDNPEVLAGLIHKLLHDEQIKMNVSSRQNFYLEKYSWDNVAKKMKKIIEQKV